LLIAKTTTANTKLGHSTAVVVRNRFELVSREGLDYRSPFKKQRDILALGAQAKLFCVPATIVISASLTQIYRPVPRKSIFGLQGMSAGQRMKSLQRRRRTFP
jgi:hypothetical protein